MKERENCSTFFRDRSLSLLPPTQTVTKMAPPRSAVAQKLQKEQDDLLPSEDEDDSDFHLSGGEDDDGGSDSSDSEREGEQRGKKRAKLEDEAPKEPV